jgi:hypothetical protein
MAATTLSEQDWQIRLHVYRFFVEQARPPTYSETAEHFGIAPEDGRAAYHRLNDAHAFFLNPGTDEIRMANPLSAVPTPYHVRASGVDLYANCAWDSLGIPAMLDVDARIEAAHPGSAEPVRYAVESGKLNAPDGLLVHFPIPFRHWYDDLIHT